MAVILSLTEKEKSFLQALLQDHLPGSADTPVVKILNKLNKVKTAKVYTSIGTTNLEA